MFKNYFGHFDLIASLWYRIFHPGTEWWLISVPINHGTCNVMISIFCKTISLLTHRIVSFFTALQISQHQFVPRGISCTVVMFEHGEARYGYAKSWAKSLVSRGGKKAVEKNVDSWFWFYLWNKYFPIPTATSFQE